VELHLDVGGLDVVEGLAGVAEDEQTRGSVVGDRVDDGDVPSGDPAVDDFQRGGEERRRRAHLGSRALRTGQVGAEDQRDLGLDLGLHEPARRAPKSGWSTPSWRCTAGDVRPILRPTKRCPAASTRSVVRRTS
jgi:hypothetical protein